MSDVGTTRMSSKGQVVIPEEVRARLGLKPGARFVVVAENDVVILRSIQPPAMDDFDELIGRAEKAARRAGMTRSDVSEAIADARKKR